MKIGILTLPIKSNYGGILQAYALVTYLRKQGYDAWSVRRRWNSENQSKLHKLFKQVYHTLIIRKFNIFIKQYIQPQTEIIDTRDKTNALLSKGFDAFVVGSDQVWRMRHVYGADYNFFLDFTENINVKRIAYAASFGVDYWDDTNSQKSLPIVKSLLKKFNAISVREDSGIHLCKSLFNVNAIKLLDPTLLLNKEEYIHNFNLKIIPKNYIAVYILDMTEEKQQIISALSQHLKLPIKHINKYSVLLEKILPNCLEEVNKPGIKEWIKDIAESKFILTDSFHGTVFSIIFEKQFIAIGNKRRGLTRFESLLHSFDLQSHLICKFEDIKNIKMIPSINYTLVNQKKKDMQELSLNFFNKYL